MVVGRTMELVRRQGRPATCGRFHHDSCGSLWTTQYAEGWSARWEAGSGNGDGATPPEQSQRPQ